MMKKTGYTTILTLLIMLLSLTAVPVIAYDDEDYEEPENKDTLEFVMGYQQMAKEEGNIFRAAEYDVTGGTTVLGLGWMTSPLGKTLFELNLEMLGGDQFAGHAAFDANRVFRLDVGAHGMYHRLDHDPMDNLQSVSHVKVVRRTDLDPTAEYNIRRRLYTADVDFQPPGMPSLAFRAGLREEQRTGHKQMISASHCTSCHAVSQGREIDQSTTDISLGAHFRKGMIDLDYQLTGRDFVENGPTTLGQYERAYHPGLPAGPDIVTPFNDRLWFQNGSYPIDMVPETERTAHKLKARAGFKGGNALNFTVIQSTTENITRGLEYDFKGYRARYNWKPKDDLRVNIYAQRDDLSNDSVYVNLLDMNGLGSAPVTNYGTFEEWRRLLDGDPTLNFTDFTRNSAMNRTDDRIGVDGVWRAMKRASMRFGAQYRSVSRDNVVLADGTGDTSTLTLKMGWNQRLQKKIRWNNSLVYQATDNPYVYVNGGMRAFMSDINPLTGLPYGNGAPSPKSPLSLQYYQLHDLRVADLSSMPTNLLKFRSNATWVGGAKWSLNGNFRYKSAENDELDYSTWDNDSVGIGANLWVAPGPKFYFTLGYDSVSQETTTLVAVPLMDG